MTTGSRFGAAKGLLDAIRYAFENAGNYALYTVDAWHRIRSATFPTPARNSPNWSGAIAHSGTMGLPCMKLHNEPQKARVFQYLLD